MGVKCFFVEPTERAKRFLRRFVLSGGDRAKCPGKFGSHNASTYIDEIQSKFDAVEECWERTPDPQIPRDDPRWPVKCEACDYRFTAADEWQHFHEQIYVDKETGREHTLRDDAPGMMWDAFWMGPWWRGPDGRCLVVVCPNGRHWMIDSQASNCTQKDDTGPDAHRCWTRTGTPPLLQVGKQFGKTCGAGGGSIQAGDYHGFLGNGGAAPGYFT